MRKTARWLLLSLLLAVAVLAAACSSGDDDEPTATQSTAATTGGASTTTGGSSPGSETVYMLYRDGNGDLIARNFGTGELFHQAVDFDSEVIVGASCSPDGSRIAYLKQVFSETTRRVLIRGEGDPEDLTIPATTQGVAWSPDNAHIAVTDFDGFAQVHKISVLDIDSGELTELEGGPDFVGTIAWSPDGATLAYYKQLIAGGETQLWTMSATGGDPDQLTNSETVKPYDPDWAPDGSNILVSGSVGEEFQLYTVDGTTGEITQITDSDIFKRGPRYSPDGTTIAYTGTVAQPQTAARPLFGLHSFGIFVVNPDGTGEQPYTADPRLNPGAQVDPYLDAFLLGWCVDGPWLDDLWEPEEAAPTR